MTDTLVTYQSKNSKPEHAWLGFIHLGGNRLDITFFGPTEEGVKAKMKEFYAKDKEVREANRAKKAAAAEAKAAKTSEAA